MTDDERFDTRGVAVCVVCGDDHDERDMLTLVDIDGPVCVACAVAVNADSLRMVVTHDHP